MKIYIRYILLIGFSSFLLFPLFQMIVTSLLPLEHVFTSPATIFPSSPYLKSYVEMFKTVPLLPRYILNSLLISVAVTFLSLVSSIPAGYAFARFKFPAKKILLFIILSINMFSPVVILLPLFKILKFFHLLNTYLSLILPGTVFVLPFSIWLLAGYFPKIPEELEEAALVDGASRSYVIFKITLPLSAPGLITTASYAFITSWGQQFIFAIAFNTVREIMPITQGLYEYFGQNVVFWNQLMAASMVSTLPVLLIFLVVQKHLVAGLVAGALKT